MPCSLWGRIRKKMGRFDLTAGANTQSSSLSKIGMDLKASVGDSKLLVDGVVDAESDSVVAVDTVQFEQSLAAAGGKLTLIPTYCMPAHKGYIELKYRKSDIEVKVNADKKKQKFAIKKVLGSSAGSIKPSIDTKGNFEFEYSRPLGFGSLAATYYKSSNIVDLKFTDGPWEARLAAPLHNFRSYNNNVKFSIQRAFDVTE